MSTCSCPGAVAVPEARHLPPGSFSPGLPVTCRAAARFLPSLWELQHLAQRLLPRRKSASTTKAFRGVSWSRRQAEDSGAHTHRTPVTSPPATVSSFRELCGALEAPAASAFWVRFRAHGGPRSTQS